jgi:hypothetical protein
MYTNQVELSKSETRLDEQFCVQGRLFISTLNEILHRADSDNVITYERVNEMFQEWEAFRNRSDFRDHMRAWFMGDDLKQLPPPPEPKQEETPTEAPGDAEDPVEFGGDYAQDSDRNQADSEEQPEVSETREEDALPEGQDPDGAARETSAVP